MRLDALEPLANRSGASVQSQISIAGLQLGSPAPNFRLDGLDGEVLTLEGLLVEAKPVLLLFTNPHCGPCQALLPEVGRWQREYGSKLTIALISEGAPTDNRAKTAREQLSRVLLQRKREVAETYRAWGTPSAVVIRPDGLIGSPLAQGPDAIRALVAQSVSGAQSLQLGAATNRPAHGTGQAPPLVQVAKVGEPPPALELLDLDGKTVALSAFHGRKVLLLFWNAGCGFCQRMLSDLQRWDSDPPPQTPSLVVLLTGTAEEGRAMGLRSPVLLDPRGRAGAAFGAGGTPMAILIDAKGRIASEVAAGAQAVFELAGRAFFEAPRLVAPSQESPARAIPPG